MSDFRKYDVDNYEDNESEELKETAKRLMEDPKKIQQALKLYDSQMYSTKEIAEITGVSVKTLYNAIAERKEANLNGGVPT